MASLATVTREGRLFLKIGGIIFAVLMVLFIFIKGGSLIQDVFFPKPPPPPEQAFGKLPKVNFPAIEPYSLTFTVNTVDGLLPKMPDRVNVYKIKAGSPDLLALTDAKKTLDAANFIENQTKISDTIYRFTQSRTGIVIEYDIISNNFSVFSNYLLNPSLVSTGLLPSEEAVISDMKGFLKTIDASTDNLDLESTKVEYLQAENGTLVAAQNLGTARFARITIPQNPIDEISTVYGNSEGSLLTFIVSYPGSRFTVLEGIFYNHEADLENKSDYPIKTAQEAFEDLKNGNAFVINLQNLENIDITNVELKYYLTRENQGYLLPIFVFTGVNFTGYVQAIPMSSIEDIEDATSESQN